MPKVALADNYTTTARQPQQQQQPLTQQTKAEPTSPENQSTIPPPQQPSPAARQSQLLQPQLPQPATTQLQPQSNPRSSTTAFTLIHKNARSLSSDDSVTELLAELHDAQWDIISINETWRTQKQEFWATKDSKHVFAGSGYEHGTRGIAFLIHHRWAKHIQRFTPVDERIAYIDVITGTHRLRIITAYFPHSGYSDAAIQRMYDTISTIISEAREQRLQIILAGDFNAQVGARSEDDTTKTIGRFALEPHNSRGEWLTSWAATERLTITNTHFDKPHDRLTTYTTPTNRPRQLDYILVSKQLWRQTRDA